MCDRMSSLVYTSAIFLGLVLPIIPFFCVQDVMVPGGFIHYIKSSHYDQTVMYRKKPFFTLSPFGSFLRYLLHSGFQGNPFMSTEKEKNIWLVPLLLLYVPCIVVRGSADPKAGFSPPSSKPDSMQVSALSTAPSFTQRDGFPCISLRGSMGFSNTQLSRESQ